ncbi:MAG: phosphatidate cytidylyltransferase [Taibaiella sp.]|nr:phosphatidate cytidylyltransferase [Taibaiella sp.]
MAFNWPTFFTRLGSAIVFSIIMLAGLLWNEWAFLLLVSAIQFLCLRDVHRLAQKIYPDVVWPGWLSVSIQVGSMAWLWLIYFSLIGMVYWPVMLCFPIIIILIAGLSQREALLAALIALGGMFYIMLPMALLLQLRMQSLLLPLALILLIWVNDTMAYLVGSVIGKRPFSDISPNKTWEGTIGGAVLTVVVAMMWGHFSGNYKLTDWMALALCAALAGTAGDLLESKLKRMANVKDSGKLMPGHGGALDRFDSLLVATPFAFCYAYFFMPALPLVIF